VTEKVRGPVIVAVLPIGCLMPLKYTLKEAGTKAFEMVNDCVDPLMEDDRSSLIELEDLAVPP